MAHKHKHHPKAPKHPLQQIRKRKDGVIESDVQSSFIDSVSLDRAAGIVTVTINGVDYDYSGDREDFQGVRREGGSYFNDVLRPQDEGSDQ